MMDWDNCPFTLFQIRPPLFWNKKHSPDSAMLEPAWKFEAFINHDYITFAFFFFESCIKIIIGLLQKLIIGIAWRSSSHLRLNYLPPLTYFTGTPLSGRLSLSIHWSLQCSLCYLALQDQNASLTSMPIFSLCIHEKAHKCKDKLCSNDSAIASHSAFVYKCSINNSSLPTWASTWKARQRA